MLFDIEALMPPAVSAVSAVFAEREAENRENRENRNPLAVDENQENRRNSENRNTTDADIAKALQSEPPNNDDPLNPLLVVAYTPLGEPIALIADDAQHKAWLIQMNPPPRYH